MAVTCMLAGCSAHSGAGRPAPSGPGSTGPGATGPGERPAWMLTRGALGQVLSDPAVAARLEAARVYEILTPGQQPLAVAGAEPVVTFSAVSALRQAVDGGQLPAGTRAVLYDPEVWPYTPVTEQRNPVRAAQQAAAVTRAHHLTLIVAPALDLATAQPARADRCGGSTCAWTWPALSPGWPVSSRYRRKAWSGSRRPTGPSSGPRRRRPARLTRA